MDFKFSFALYIKFNLSISMFSQKCTHLLFSIFYYESIALNNINCAHFCLYSWHETYKLCSNYFLVFNVAYILLYRYFVYVIYSQYNNICSSSILSCTCLVKQLDIFINNQAFCCLWKFDYLNIRSLTPIYYQRKLWGTLWNQQRYKFSYRDLKKFNEKYFYKELKCIEWSLATQNYDLDSYIQRKKYNFSPSSLLINGQTMTDQ